MGEQHADVAAELVHGFIGGRIDVATFEARFVELATHDAGAVARVGTLVERLYVDGNFPLAAHDALDAVRRSRQAELRPGVVVNGRFVLEEKIGVGTAGVVFKARDPRAEPDRELVAIRFLDGLQFVPAALHEIRTARALAHPNIVQVYELDTVGLLPFVHMELVEAETLNRLAIRSKGMPFAVAWPIILGVGTVLAHAHRNGITHSDLEPHNVFVTRDGRVKVSGFAVPRVFRVTAFPFVSQWHLIDASNPRYKSPELIAGRQPEPRDDVFALACLAYQLLSGRTPTATREERERFDASAARLPGLSTRRTRALQRAAALERAARTPSVDEFLAELTQAPNPNRWIARAGIVAVGCAVAAALLVYWFAAY